MPIKIRSTIFRSTRKSLHSLAEELPDDMIVLDIIFSEKLSRAIKGECNFAMVGLNTDSNNEPKSK